MASTAILNNAAIISNFESDLGFPKDSLLNSVIMESELKPSAKNPKTGASGLIQLMPSKLAEWGYTPTQVRSMSVTQQLPLIAKYFKQYSNILSRFADPFEYYCTIFWPAAMGKPDSFIITSNKNSSVYQYNKIYAQNGVITKGSMRRSFYDNVAQKKKELGLTSSAGKKNNNGSGGNSSLTNIINNLRFFFIGR